MEASDLFSSKTRKPRKIIKITPSNYENAEAIHSNKKHWNQVFTEFEKSSSDVFEESKLISQVLPPDLYEKVCTTLNMPIINRRKEKEETLSGKLRRRLVKEPMISFRKWIVVDREMDSDTDVEICDSDEEEDAKPNIYQQFLSKPEREQVTWDSHYLQSEREDEKTLIRKADDLTDKIANKFCQYMKELGGDQQSNLFTPKAIKELFQIEFDTHVSRSLRVISKELPCIEENVAIVTGNPEKSRYAALEREISKDLKAERKPDINLAFARSIPLKDQYRAPRNNTRKLWRSARHVPKDLVTLKTVWEGITNLRSVREYCRWMIDHPEHKKPPYLSSLGMFDTSVLNAKGSFEAKHRPTVVSSHDKPMDRLRSRLT